MVGFIAGFLVGDLIWFGIAATGMAMLAQNAHVVFLTLKYAGAVYLLYLAYRLWTAPVQPIASQVDDVGRSKSDRLFLAGLALTLGNPKTMIFFMALLPTLIDLKRITPGPFLQVAAIMSFILPMVLGSYALAAQRARRVFRSTGALRWLNRTCGTVMGGAAVVVASR